jgi:enoyl-CoA hydratase/carnithine racemase
MIKLDVLGPHADITISQPARLNAIGFLMWQQLRDALHLVTENDAVRIVCLRGEGDGAFSAGGDISEYDELAADLDKALAYHRLFKEVLETLRSIPKPTIAVISGYCIGAGLTLATACDFRIGSSSARFGITAVKRGLIYPVDSTSELIELVGIRIVRSLILGGRQLAAVEALDAGLLDEVVEVERLDMALAAWTERLAAGWGRPFAMAKGVIREARTLPAESEAIRALHAEAFRSEAFAAGIEAFTKSGRGRHGT